MLHSNIFLQVAQGPRGSIWESPIHIDLLNTICSQGAQGPAASTLAKTSSISWTGFSSSDARLLLLTSLPVFSPWCSPSCCPGVRAATGAGALRTHAGSLWFFLLVAAPASHLMTSPYSVPCRIWIQPFFFLYSDILPPRSKAVGGGAHSFPAAQTRNNYT